MIRYLIILLLAGKTLLLDAKTYQPKEDLVSEKNAKGWFPLAEEKRTAAMMVSSEDFPGVIRAFKDLQDDIRKVTSILPSLYEDRLPSSKFIILAGTIDKSPIIKKLSDEGKIDVHDIRGKWEAFVIQTIRNPFPGVKQALVIAGSDKRGTIYGIYELSERTVCKSIKNALEIFFEGFFIKTGAAAARCKTFPNHTLKITYENIEKICGIRLTDCISLFFRH